jgi:hypothetical protein
MQEVQLTHQANTAMDVYRELYLARYKKKPIIPSTQFAAAITVFKDLIREVELPHTLALIRQYLRMNGDRDWYKNHGHSLTVFAKNIDAINAATPVKAAPADGKKFYIAIETQCPTCKKYFLLKTTVDDAANAVYMTACEKCARPSF